MATMADDLRRVIAERYPADCWDPITGPIWEDGAQWQLWLFSRDVEHSGQVYRCHIIQRVEFDTDDPDTITEAEDIFSNAFPI